jgi:aminoglycoside phosphotransferase (APT) family kinase protein
MKPHDDESLDSPRAVREGEELDRSKLVAYFSTRLPELGADVEIEQFPSGFSNLTYLVRAATGQEFVLRRPPVGAKIKTAHDMSREFFILKHLHPVYPKVPRPVLFCDDESVLGAPFYLMERVRGVILRARPPAALALTPEIMGGLSESFIQNLAEIHEVDYAAAGLGELGRSHGYVRRQIEGWTKRYYNARTDDVPAIEKLAVWLAANAPADSGRALIHNDYKYDNIMFAPVDLSRVVAVLDWEMATIGDPLMDLGTAIGYWVDPEDPEEWQRFGFGLTTLPGNLKRSELIELYARRSGRDIPDIVFYYAYGLFKTAVIVQQIYYRFRQGFTKDARFSSLGLLVKACGNLAERAIEKRRIERLG